MLTAKRIVGVYMRFSGAIITFGSFITGSGKRFEHQV